MMTSRDIPHVVEEVQSAVRLEVQAHDEDVQIYVDGQISELRRFVSRDPELQQIIRNAIVSAVDGMFLLARLHVESLKDKMNPAEMRLALRSLPKGGEALSIAYDQAMLRIEAQKPGVRNLALKAMSWMTYAERLLTASEVRYALGVHKDIFGRTALAIAARRGNASIVSSLLDCAGIEVNSVDHDRQTALSLVAYDWSVKEKKDVEFAKHEAIVKLLLTRTDIYIECIDKEGNNLLSRVTTHAEETSEPRLEGTIALLRAAMEDGSRPVREWRLIKRAVGTEA